MTEPLVAPVEDLEIQILDELDSAIPCSYTDCDGEATHILVCGACYTGREFMCGPHTIQTAAAKMQIPEERVIFDQTCKHGPELGNCDIEPIAA